MVQTPRRQATSDALTPKRPRQHGMQGRWFASPSILGFGLRRKVKSPLHSILWNMFQSRYVCRLSVRPKVSCIQSSATWSRAATSSVGSNGPLRTALLPPFLTNLRPPYKTPFSDKPPWGFKCTGGNWILDYLHSFKQCWTAFPSSCSHPRTCNPVFQNTRKSRRERCFDQNGLTTTRHVPVLRLLTAPSTLHSILQVSGKPTARI